MRDAASLLDQASVYGEGKVTKEIVETFLGILSKERVREFLKLLLDSEVDSALSSLQEISEKGYNLTRFWESLGEEIRKVILVKSLQNPEKLVENWQDYEEFKKYPLEALLYIESIVNRGSQEARTREPLWAYELAVIKTKIVKDIIPVSQLDKLAAREETKEEVEGEQTQPKAVTEIKEEKKIPSVEEIIESVENEPSGRP